jgi:hypothetical protein
MTVQITTDQQCQSQCFFFALDQTLILLYLPFRPDHQYFIRAGLVMLEFRCTAILHHQLKVNYFNLIYSRSCLM